MKECKLTTEYLRNLSDLELNQVFVTTARIGGDKEYLDFVLKEKRNRRK